MKTHTGMKQTMNVDWLEDITVDRLIAMIYALPRFEHKGAVTGKENRDNIKLPMFNLVFDDCCRRMGRIPSQEEYADAYIKKAAATIRKNKLNIENLRKRCYRNIFSFIQEYAIFVVLNNAGINGLYDRAWDFKGVDFIIYNKKRPGGKFGILSHAGTPNAQANCRMKDKLRRHGIDFECVELISDKSHLEYVNNIGLFLEMKDIKKCTYPNFYHGQED